MKKASVILVFLAIAAMSTADLQKIRVFSIDKRGYVMTEKVQKSEVFANQRTRWISAQIIYLRKYWLKAIYSFFCGKFDYANKVTHYALVPKVLLIGFLFIMTIISYFLPKDIIVGFNFW